MEPLVLSFKKTLEAQLDVAQDESPHPKREHKTVRSTTIPGFAAGTVNRGKKLFIVYIHNLS
jgi:hypothetical protein